MPLYEYKCKSCGKLAEIRHGFKESVSEPCAACGGELTRVFNAAGIVFKGSGFYINDSRKASGGTGTSAASGSAKDATPATGSGDAASSSDSSGAKTSSEPAKATGDTPKTGGDAPKTGGDKPASGSSGKSDTAA